MQNSNASIRYQDRIRIMFLLRVALLNAAGLFLFTPMLHGGPVNTISSALAAPAKPVAPSALTLKIAGDTRIDLTWTDNSNNEEGFQIERRLSTSTVYTLVETLGPNFEVFSDTTITRDTKYFYRLRAYNNEGASNYSNIVNGTTSPLAPSGLTAKPVSTKRIDLVWIDKANTEESFEVERRLATVETYTRIATLAPNSVAFSDSGLIQNTKYFYRLRTTNAGGESAYSAAVSVTTLPTPPKAPIQLNATTVSSAQINLTWQDKADNEAGFNIERSLASSPLAYVEVAKVGANVTSFSSAALSPNTKYYYRVRAYNLGGQSAFTNEASATTLPTKPSAPGSLTATTISNTRIDLVWQDNATNEDSFKIERRKGPTGPFTSIATTGANVKKYSDSGLAANTAYSYRVRALNLGGYSDYSNEANATTLPDRPSAPTNLTATTVSNTQINLAWQDNATNEDSFKIERKVGVAGKYVKLATLEANAKRFSDKNLAANTEYFYRLRAINIGGESDYSNETNTKTFPNPPGAPSNLVATTISNSLIKLAWRDNATNEDGFQIERKKGAAGAFVQIAIAGANVKQFADSGLIANTLYFYRLRAFNTGNRTDYSDEASATTLPDRPAAPSHLTATAASNMQIDLAWQDNSANEDSFKVERSSASLPQGSLGVYKLIAVLGADTKVFSDKGLTEKTEYFYRVRASNRGGYSDYSNQANAQTFPNPPGAPSNLLVATISNSRLKLTWQDNATNEEGFQIERKKGAAGAFGQIAIVRANTGQFADSGLASNTLYFYRLRAFNTGNHTDYSNEASATTLPDKPGAPGNLVATTVSNTQIKLVWQDKAVNEDSFKIERGSADSPQGAPVVYKQIAVVGANTKEFLDRALAANTGYVYRLRAANRGGHSDYSNEASAKTFPNPPAAPGNVTAATMSYNRINLAWKDNANNEVGFKIERGSISSPLADLPDTFVEIAQVGANVVSFADTGLAGNTKYFYRLRAYNPGGPSAYSVVVSSTTLPGPPQAPSNLSTTVVIYNRINLAWQDNATNEAGFRVERKIGAAGKFEEIIAVGANATSYANTGLTEKTQYFYRVRAYNAGGFSSYSEVLEITTPPIPPVAPGDLSATPVRYNQINLAWTDSSNNEAGFKIERKLGAQGTFAEIVKVDAGIANYSDSTLTGNTAYYYRVRAFNDGGHSGYTNEAHATTLPNPPAAPTNLSTNMVGPNLVNLTWQDHAINETGFKIERKSGAAGVYEEIIAVGANITKYANTGLKEKTPYFYRVRAYNAGGYSNYSNVLEISTPPVSPEVPANLVATTVSNTQINLTWQDKSANEDSFEIERKLGGSAGSPAGVYEELAKVGANVTSYTDKNLAGNTAYFYRVRAFNDGGHSDYSNEASNTTLPNPPAAPINLTAITVSGKQINLAWQDKANNEDSFKIERKEGETGKYVIVGGVGANVKSFADSSLVPNTPYFYRLRAFNRGGFSDYSNEARAVTLPLVPATPQQLIAKTISTRRINLMWADSANNEVGFEIERRPASAGSIPPAAYTKIATVAANTSSYADSNLTANTAYAYRVRAFNTGGFSLYSNEAGATTLPNPPVAPTQLTATTRSNTQIDLQWQDNSTNEDSFKLERKLGAAGAYKQIARLRANAKSFADTALAANTPYFYRVRAYNRGGNSGYSNEANTATLPNRPGTPSNLTAATISNTQINLKWQDNSANEDSFKIERRSTGLLPAYVEIAKVGANVTSYSDNGLTADVTYFYRVRTVNAGGHSSYSNEANATTLPNLPGVPTQLTATTVSNKQIDLKWQDNSANEDSFKIERGSKSAPGTYKEIAVLRANANSFADTTLTANTLYFYRVRAYNRGGHSGYSNEANATTLPNRPGAPANLIATTVSNARIDLAWQDFASNEEGFAIERGSTGLLQGSASSPLVFVEVAKTGPNLTSYADLSVAENTTYFYRVRAMNAGGYSAYSNQANATTLPSLPGKPTQLTATPISNTRIDLKWQDNSTNEDSFKIERKLGGSTGLAAEAYIQIAVLPAETSGFADTALTANTPYIYRLRAYNRAGPSDYSNEAQATTLPNRPDAPTNLAATTASNKRIDLTWKDAANNEDGFKIERGSPSSPQGSATSPQTYVEVAKVGPNVTSYADNSVSANTTFFYRVRAYNAGGHSNYTNEANATTLPNVPGTPAQLTATTVSNKRIDLAWQDNATNEDSFKLERKFGGSPAGPYKQIALLRANVKSFADTALTPNTMYSYRVRAFNRGGHSAYSNEATAVTLPNRPSAPSNLTATTLSNTKIDLKWQDNSANEDSFKIERRSTSSPQAYVEVAKVGPDVTNYSDNTLVANTTFFYRVRAYNRGGHSNYTNEANATTLPNLPGTPLELTATAVSNKQIDLKWQDNSTDEDSFKVERKLGGSAGSPAGEYKQIAALRPNTKSFVDTTLVPNTSYFYRVRALNRGGHSDYSNEANAMTLPNPPVAPSHLIATAISNTQIDLTWQDRADNEAGFVIERKTNGAAGSPEVYVEVARVGPNVTTYADNNLTAITAYFYRVSAFNIGGNSVYSNDASATTLPNPPGNPGPLSATAVSNKAVDLIWQDNSVDEDSFKIERRIGTAGKYKIIVGLAANASKYSDTGLTPNTLYFYRVRALNRGGYSAYSNEANTLTLPNPPAPPARLRATAISQNQINLAWADSAGFKVGFKIERKTLDGTYAQIDTVDGSITSYENTGLLQDTQYFYRIRAYNAGGQSGFSNETGAKTLPIPPVAPVNLTARAISSSQVDLAWADSAKNETGFKIERRTPQSNFVEIATTGANVTAYSNIEVVSNTRYFYRVRAYNRGNHSAYSNVAEILTPSNPPTAPRDLVATTRINLQIDLEWVDTASSEDSFKIERKIGKTGVYVLVATIGKDVVSYSDVNLQPVTQYFYRIRAINPGGPSAYSNETGAATLVRPPVAPKSLTAVALSNTRARLTWADSSNNENGFQIDRRTNTTGVYVTIATVAANVKSLVDSSLSGGLEYFYRVRAYNTGGHSGYSNEANAKTPIDPPGKPTNLTATAESTTRIKLAWLDNAINEVGFQIERKNEATAIYAPIATVGPNIKSFVDSNLVVNTGYFYRVRAFNAGGNSNYTNEVSTKTLPNMPAAPSNLAATVASAHRVNLVWADNSNNETGFQVERKTGATGVYGEIAIVTANVKRFADSSLAGKTTYFYRIRAYNAGGVSAYSNEVDVTTLPSAPLPPTNLTITAVSNQQIKLIWTDNSINESNFRVERRTTAAGTFTVIAAVNANVTTFADTGVAALTPYYYRVYAFNAGGNSLYSNEASATTLPNPPARPDSLVATPVNHLQINLKWKDLSDNESGFQVERKIGVGGKFIQIASVGAGVTNYFDSNLVGNKEYFYRVRAFNAGGLSNYSNEFKSTTLPIPPGSLTGGSLSNRRLYIVWTDSSNNESGFRIERRLFETEFTEVGFVGTNVRSYADSNLTPNTVYYYRVRAFNFGGLSAYSNEAAVATLPNAPSRPRGLNIKRLPNLRLALTWTDSSNNEIGFAIERRLVADTAFAEAGIVNANIATFVDTGLVAETRYFYRVRGFNTGGYSLYSNEANNVTLGAPPLGPGELSATSGGNTKINLLWADYSNNESGFKIERKVVSDTVYAEIASVGANIINYADNDVTKDVAYMYRVRAFNDGGTSNYTNEAGATPSNDINLAVGKPALASSADLGATANRAIDGNLATYWRSDTVTATTPQAWLRVELSPTSQIIIDRVVIRWYQNFFAPAFEIQVSDNGTHWTTVYTTEAGKAGTQETAFAQTPARFVRLYMKRNNKANFRVAELEVYNGFAKTAHQTAAGDAMIPETVTLQPNYPNPFNPATTISYALPKETAVTLKVLNVAGQEVATLVERRQERGIYHVTFNARKLPSGVYFAVLQAGDVRQVHQMLLTK